MIIDNYNVHLRIDKRRTTIGINLVGEDMTIISPIRLNDKQLEFIFKENIESLLEKIKKRDEKLSKMNLYESFVTDNGCLYLGGKKYNITILKKQKQRVIKKDDNLIFEVKSNSAFITLVRTEMINFLESIVSESLKKYCKILNLKMPKYDFLEKKSAYAVCYPKRLYIEFNLNMSALPADLIDYIVAHEMVHFIHQNHSKYFKDELRFAADIDKAKEKRLKNTIVKYNY